MINPLFGKAFKALRVAKNIEAKAVASDELSYSQLLKFEQGKTSLTVEKLLAALNAINASFNEFEHTSLELTDTANLVLNKQIEKAYWSNNLAALEKLIAQIEQKLKNQPDNTRMLLNKIEAEASLSRLKPSYQPPQADVEQLYAYLMSVNEFGKYEALLLMNTAPVFTDAQLVKVTHKMLHPEVANIAGNRLQSNIDGALLTVIRELIARKVFEPIREYFTYLESHVLPDFNMYERAQFTYLKALFHFREQPNRENLADVERCIEAFKTLECFGLANFSNQELELYRKESQI